MFQLLCEASEELLNVTIYTLTPLNHYVTLTRSNPSHLSYLSASGLALFVRRGDEQVKVKKLLEKKTTGNIEYNR